MMSLDALAQWRHPLATLVTAASVGLAAALLLRPAPPRQPQDNVVMHVALIAATPVPKLVEPPAPVPPQPPAVKRADRAVPKAPVVDHPKMAEPATADGPPTPQSKADPEPAAPPSPPPQPAAASAGFEAAYSQKALAEVESHKRYPMSKDARLLRPTGSVVVVFTLSRDGTLQDVSIDTSAGSILDEQALVTVRRSHFPPFPKEAWPGETTHRFLVKLNFAPS